MEDRRVGISGGRRLILAALLPLALLASSVLVTPARAAVLLNTSVPITITPFVPCANGGTGEVIEVSGPLHILSSVTFDGRGGFHAHDLFNPQDIRGFGLITGSKYQATGETEDDLNGTVGFTYTYVNNFDMIGQGPGNNFTVHENLHLTVNANGTLTTFVDNFRVSCM